MSLNIDLDCAMKVYSKVQSTGLEVGDKISLDEKYYLVSDILCKENFIDLLYDTSLFFRPDMILNTNFCRGAGYSVGDVHEDGSYDYSIAYRWNTRRVNSLPVVERDYIYSTLPNLIRKKDRWSKSFTSKELGGVLHNCFVEGNYICSIQEWLGYNSLENHMGRATLKADIDDVVMSIFRCLKLPKFKEIYRINIYSQMNFSSGTYAVKFLGDDIIEITIVCH